MTELVMEKEDHANLQTKRLTINLNTNYLSSRKKFCGLQILNDLIVSKFFLLFLASSILLLRFFIAFHIFIRYLSYIYLYEANWYIVVSDLHFKVIVKRYLSCTADSFLFSCISWLENETSSQNSDRVISKSALYIISPDSIKQLENICLEIISKGRMLDRQIVQLIISCTISHHLMSGQCKFAVLRDKLPRQS